MTKTIFATALIFLWLNQARAQVNTPWVTTAANIGIGTTSPSSLLHVHNNTVPVFNPSQPSVLANFSGNTGNIVNFRFLFNRHTNAGGWENVGGRLQYITDVTNQGYIEFNPKGAPHGVAIGVGNVEAMKFTHDRYTGLYQPNPMHRLDIGSYDNEGATRLRIANTTSTGSTAPGSHPTLELLGARGDANATFGGRIALGTRRTDGTALFNQILGQIAFGGQYGTDQTFQASKILYSSSIQGVAEGSFSSASAMPVAITFRTGQSGEDIATPNYVYGTERMRISSNGNVGIGTSVPQALLSVNGDVFAKKVKVTQTGWPDYVFDSSYQLRPLAVLEEYIRVNKHLPDVRPTEYIEVNGLDIGENSAAMLRKIEELTLYTIQQQKIIAGQGKEISDLKALVDKLAALVNTISEKL